MIKRAIILIHLVFLSNCSFFAHPSDTEMLLRFRSHKTEFVQLLTMLSDDKEIVRLTDKNVFYSDAFEGNISNDRFKEYRTLLTKLQLDYGVHRDNASTVRFIASSKGFPVASSEKSFVYSTSDLSPLAGSLDDLVYKKNQQQVFRKIEENWYLGYESW